MSNSLREKTKEYDRVKACRRRLNLQHKRSADATRQRKSRLLRSLKIDDTQQYGSVMKKMCKIAADSPAKYKELLNCLKDNCIVTKQSESQCKGDVNATPDMKQFVEKPVKKEKFKSPVIQLRCYKQQNRAADHEALVQKIVEEHGSVWKAAQVYGLHHQTLQNLCTLKEKKETKRQLQFKERVDHIAGFFHLDTISKVMPVARLANKRFMAHTYEEAYEIYKANCETHDVKALPFSTYFRLKPKNIYSVTDLPMNECCCRSCLNLTFSKNSLINNKVQGVPKSSSEGIRKTLCSDVTDVSYVYDPRYGKYPCIIRLCDDCSTKLLENEILQQNPNLEKDDRKVTWKRWQYPEKKPENVSTQKGKKEKKKQEKIDIFEKEGTRRDLLTVYLNDLNDMASHCFNWKWHDSMYEYIKENLRGKMLLQVLDFSQNWLNKYQVLMTECIFY